MIVVDTSVLVPAFVESADSPAARHAVAADAVWILPPLWKFEFTNAIVQLLRNATISDRAAQHALVEARIAVSDREVPVDQLQALRLAIDLNLSGYDAQYVALAQAYGVRCVTADRQLARRASPSAILLAEYSSDLPTQ
jgi:predicted nucleic acid-binding protein